jgi:hypothetical protein
MTRLSMSVRWGLGVSLVLVSISTPLGAQAGPESRLRIGAGAGGYVPRSSVVRVNDGSDTRLSAGPAFTVDLEYLVVRSISGFLSGSVAFPTLRLGSAIRSDVQGPSNQVMLLGSTAGVLVAIPGVSSHFRPIVRVGGGLKAYSFDLTDTKNQSRLTGDFGIGFRGLGNGLIEVGAEVRYLPSSFDQSKLPTGGIVPQNQRQNDWLFGLTIGIHP